MEAVESGRVTAELREKLGLPGNERVATGLLRTWAQDGTIARLIEDVQAGQVRGEMERRRVDSRGRGAMIGTTGEGGKGYGEGTQWKGIDPFGRKTILYDSGRWKYGKGAGEQAGGLDKSARTGRYSSIQDRRRINYDGLRRNGVQEQQIDNFRYMEIAVRDLPPELRAIREQNFGRGIETVFVLDDIQLHVEINGRERIGHARGFADNGKVYIKVNNDYTAEQINGHETFHVEVERYRREYKNLQYSVAKLIPNNIMENALAKYIKKYKYIYDAKQITALAREELLADIAGGMSPLANIPGVQEAVGRFYDRIYGKGAGEEFLKGIEWSTRYSLKESAGEGAFLVGKNRAEIEELFWAENGRLNETIGLEQDIGTLAPQEQALCREVQEAVESGRVTAELKEKLGLPGNDRVAVGLLRTWAQDGTIARLIGDVQAGQVRGELERRGEWSNGEAEMPIPTQENSDLSGFGNPQIDENGDIIGNIIIDDKQLGRKMGKHAQDYGLDPHDENDRIKFREIIDDIVQNYDEIRVGTWRDLGEYLENGRRADGEVIFLIKKGDVVILRNGNFVTILENGITNARIRNAKIVYERN